MNKKALTIAESRLDTQIAVKGGQIQDSERETNQLIKKTGLEKQNAELTHVTNLFPYSLIPLFPSSRRCLILTLDVQR